MQLDPKSIYRSLIGAEIGLSLAALVMLTAANGLREEKGFLYFLIIVGVSVVVPVTLIFLCEAVRYFLRKEFTND